VSAKLRWPFFLTLGPLRFAITPCRRRYLRNTGEGALAKGRSSHSPPPARDGARRASERALETAGGEDGGDQGGGGGGEEDSISFPFLASALLEVLYSSLAARFPRPVVEVTPAGGERTSASSLFSPRATTPPPAPPSLSLTSA